MHFIRMSGGFFLASFEPHVAGAVHSDMTQAPSDTTELREDAEDNSHISLFTADLFKNRCYYKGPFSTSAFYSRKLLCLLQMSQMLLLFFF